MQLQEETFAMTSIDQANDRQSVLIRVVGGLPVSFVVVGKEMSAIR